MRRTRAIVCSLMATSMLASVAGVGLAASAKGTKANPIGASASGPFQPGKVKVKAGATVWFRNLDGAPHNAAATKLVNGKPAFRSGSLSSGSFKLKIPANLKAGTYRYHCELHSNMVGTLVVTR